MAGVPGAVLEPILRVKQVPRRHPSSSAAGAAACRQPGCPALNRAFVPSPPWELADPLQGAPFRLFREQRSADGLFPPPERFAKHSYADSSVLALLIL